MGNFNLKKLDLEGAYIINNTPIKDDRGEFYKCFEKDVYRDAGINFNLNETFTSTSKKNVIRGIHFQSIQPQAKIVSVIYGKVWDVIVDLRPDSATYKQWLSFELSVENHNCIYVPRGFGHGFVSLEEESTMLYQCDGKYIKEYDTGILYNDLSIGINWPIDSKNVILSERDCNLMSIEEFEKKVIFKKLI